MQVTSKTPPTRRANGLPNLSKKSLYTPKPWTPEQQVILNDTSPVVIVDAPAGTGKSELLQAFANKHPRGLYLGFTKKMVEDMAGKIDGWQCKTFNSFGLGICAQHDKFSVDFNKGSDTGIMELVNKHMQLDGPLTKEGWMATCDRFRIPHFFIKAAIEEFNRYINDTGVIGGEEMMYRPVMNGWKSRYYPVVMVDEVQDMNPLQIQFLKLIPTDKLILVGDSKQSIHGFRGADPEVIHKLSSYYKAPVRTLNLSFSMPQKVLKMVQDYIPGIQSMGPPGYTARGSLQQVTFDADSLILCRSNSGVANMALYLFQNNIQFSVVPRTVEKLRMDVDKYCRDGLQTAREKLNADIAAMRAMYAKHNWGAGVIQEVTSGMAKLLSSFNTKAEIYAFLDSLDMYSKKSHSRKLMTIHTAKGTSSPSVYYFNPGVSQTIAKNLKTRWEKEQEDNLYYVACTRSTNKLVLVNP